ncbi:MAG TPA: hypothetical protein VGP18_07320 [Solirubrobacteraceae bacterium]|jgi:hypothetical protein|nr:hypothetical protein [Solirubrobacteraceae bacterium]
MGEVAHAVLRANSGYELVLLDRLTGDEREPLTNDGEVYGILRPFPGSDLEPRTASTDTALLFLTLREPQMVPAYVRGRLGDDTDRVIARLVLDGVLEIERDGEFVSGPRAGQVLLNDRSIDGRGCIGSLSTAALRYGQELAAIGLTEQALALRLYGYGRRPVTPGLASLLGKAKAIEDHFGIGVGSASRRSLEAGWVRVPSKLGEQPYWRNWQARRRRGGDGGKEGGFKLYVSPSLEALAEVFRAVAGSLVGARGISAFKLGIDVHGLCRPDKLVVYFDRLEDLQDGATTLLGEIDGAPAHGVPFTATVTSDGLLSWGVDPPLLDGSRTSWRYWVSERLAEYLVSSAIAEIEPWQFALERLRLTGIDTDTWIPANGMWEQALAGA